MISGVIGLTTQSMARMRDLVHAAHVTEELRHAGERGDVLRVGARRVRVGSEQGLESVHHGVARRGFAAHVGHGTRDDHGVDAAIAQFRRQVARAGEEGAIAVLLHPQVAGLDVELVPQRMAGRALHQALEDLGGKRRRHHIVEEQRPVAGAAAGIGGLHPGHAAAGRAQRRREAVDGGDDGPRGGDGGGRLGQHEAALHVDHHQSRAAGLERVEEMQLAPAPHQAFGDVGGEVGRMRGGQSSRWNSSGRLATPSFA
jgi:hypothetical protein